MTAKAATRTPEPVRRGCAPLARPDARALVLGSRPGEASLCAGEYYAHPRNAFWPIVGALFGFDARAPYALRVAALTAAGVALWDVLAACERPGSLDADIVPASEVPNDIPAFLADHAGITTVFFNGAHAQAAYRRHFGKRLAPATARLPSTSPAHAARDFAAKLAAWRLLAARLD